MSKHNILASISMLFDNLSPPHPNLPEAEQRARMDSRKRAQESLIREVEAIFSERDELLAVLKNLLTWKTGNVNIALGHNGEEPWNRAITIISKIEWSDK